MDRYTREQAEQYASQLRAIPGLYTDVKVHSGACYWELHAENFCGVAVTLLPKAPEPVQQTRTFPTID